MAKRIQLTKGRETVVDDEDFEHLMSLNLRWSLNGPYAYNGSLGLLHRYLLKLPKGKQREGRQKIHVDHIDGDTLNNRRANLRKASVSQNQQNRKRKFKGHSEFKGAHWDSRAEHWMARIRVDGKLIYLGCCDTDFQAAKMYNEAAKKHFGEFASLNVLDESKTSKLVKKRQRRRSTKFQPI